MNVRVGTRTSRGPPFPVLVGRPGTTGREDGFDPDHRSHSSVLLRGLVVLSANPL